MNNKQKTSMFILGKNVFFRKKRAICKRFATMLVFCLFLTSCSSSQLTLESLLTSVNEEHQSIERTDVNPQQYVRKPIENARFDARMNNLNLSWEEFNENKELSWQEVQEDINYLFDFLHDSYGLYDYFGGEQKFNAAQSAILEECRNNTNTTSGILEQSILKHFTFVKDAHFSINQKFPATNTYPFFYREVEYIKVNDTYQTEKGKRIASIEGIDDLDELMKRSISSDGKIVYYPVVLQKCENYDKTFDEQEYTINKQLIVHYEDGSEQILTPEPFKLYQGSTLSEDIYKLEEIDDIPILRIDQFNQSESRTLNEYMEVLKDAPIAILDLRSNGGGDVGVARGLMQRYVGQNISDSVITMDSWKGIQLDTEDKVWVEKENILIILVGKYTVSAAENMIDMAYSLENTIIIGENTNGGMYGGGIVNQLPNSKMLIGCATWQFYIPTNNSFEELRGFLPDIWVPAGEAKDLILKYIKT